MFRYNRHMWLTWVEQNAVLSLIIGLFLGGIIAGASVFLGNLLYRRFTRPILEWGQVRVRGATLPHHLPEGGSGVAFYSSMISVHNKGKSAAENCSGHIEIDGNREHVCWFLPHARRVLTINRDDFEFLEVCAVQEEYTAAIGLEPTPRRRIAPTEDGWQPAGSNRDLDLHGIGPIDAMLIVTAANARGIKTRVVIQPIATLPEPEARPLFIWIP